MNRNRIRSGPWAYAQALPSAIAAVLLVVGCGGKLDLGDNLALYSGPVDPDASPSAGGATTPGPIATEQGQATDIASDGKRIYWFAEVGGTRDGVLKGCDPSDCRGTLVTYAAHQGTSAGIAADGKSVYWVAEQLVGMVTSYSIRGCPVSGCDGAGAREIGTAPVVGGFTSDGTYLYWFEADKTVQRCSAVGCGQSPEVVTTLDGSPTSLAVDDSSVYVTVTVTQGTTEIGRVLAFDKSGGSPTRLLADNQQSPGDVVVSGQRVLWANQHDNGAILSCPRDGCAGSTGSIASAQSRPTRLAVDEANAYWVTDQGTALMAPGADFVDIVRCPLAGCTSPTVLAPQQQIRSQLVAAGASLFWLDPNPPLAGSSPPTNGIPVPWAPASVLGVHK